MFPFLVHVSQGSLSTDDIAWISRLYPAGGTGGFAATHGTIRGIVYFSDGESHVQFANVIARRVDTGGNEDRRIAVSGVAGYRFRACVPNEITNPPTPILPAVGLARPGPHRPVRDPRPGRQLHDRGREHRPVVHRRVERRPGDFPIALPGAAPPPSAPITVSAGADRHRQPRDAHRHAAALRPVRGIVTMRSSATLRHLLGLAACWRARRLRRRRRRRRRRAAQHHLDDRERRRDRRRVQRHGHRDGRPGHEDLQHQRRRPARGPVPECGGRDFRHAGRPRGTRPASRCR